MNGSASFVEAEQVARDFLGWTELDEERAKAARVKQVKPIRDDVERDDVETALPVWEAKARARGVEYVTFRRLAEVLGPPAAAELRAGLKKRSPSECSMPLWRVAD